MPTKKQRLPRTRMGGRFVNAFDKDLLARICWEVAEGKSLTEVMKSSKHCISLKTLWEWMDKFPEAAEMMAKARLLSSFSFEDKGVDAALELLEGKVTDPAKVRAYDVAMNQLRWTAGKRNPKVFSDKIPPQITMGIQINTPLDLGEGHGKEIQGVYTIEATVNQEDQDVELPKTPFSNKGPAPRLQGSGNDAGRAP